jgi:phage terminase large subunit
MLQTTTAQNKISKLRKRVRVVQGGSSASKTFSIIPILIDYAIRNPKKEISIVAETIPHLRRGAIRDFIKILDWTGLYNPERFNLSTLKYEFSNGSFIEFFSADQPQKLRGARRDVLFINEANNVTLEAYNELAIRTREFIYLDFNPVAEFWVHTDIVNDKDTDFIILTYKDNEALEPAIIKEIEKAKEKGRTSKYWANWYKVYGQGQIGSLVGAVYEDWQPVDEIPSEAKLIGHGLDFGYTDATALVSVYQMDGKNLYIKQQIYNSLLISELGKLIKSLTLSGVIYADSAEPKSIAELKNMGITIVGADKGKDSVMYGIQRVQQYKLHVTTDSLDLIKELRSYTWQIDRNGKSLNYPIDAWNHALDALRYCITSANKYSGKYNYLKI